MRFNALALQIFQKKEELLFCEIWAPGPQGPRLQNACKYHIYFGFFSNSVVFNLSGLFKIAPQRYRKWNSRDEQTLCTEWLAMMRFDALALQIY